jgi:ubiquinone/menaquinone biosynthesis C-methylase UbiE
LKELYVKKLYIKLDIKRGLKMECYKDFAKVYDKLIYGDVDYKEWSNCIMSICDKYAIGKVRYLDLACGTGNMTIELGKYFKNTWAVDLSYDMLTEAEDKLRSNKIKAKFVCQDITNLNLKGKFDLVTCILDSTNYILDTEKLKSYFESVYNHLDDHGMFIFDMNSYYKLTKILGNNVYNYDDDDVVYIWENILEDDIVEMYLTFFIKEGEKYTRFDEQHKERAYKDDFISEILRETGFTILEKLNNYENEKIGKDTERIVYVLMKK